jgi:hypothetical protein
LHSSYFGEIRTLQLEGDSIAADLLERAAHVTLPVMACRGWYVRSLVEFLPRGERLLGRNWNKGEKIEIRLRKSKREQSWYSNMCFRDLSAISFFPFEEIVGTLLHELVHNSIGPHGRQFKNLLEVIRQECEENMITRLSVPVIPDCGYTLGGDIEAYEKYAQKDLSLFAAESRLALGIQTHKRGSEPIELSSEDEAALTQDNCIILID